MAIYNTLISAEKNSLSELKINYLIDIDTLEKICACSVAAKINDELNPVDGNLLIVIDGDGSDSVLFINDNTALALSPTFITVSNRLPVFDMLKSIRTITNY
jgi:hypothetical protein